ncbi:MAG: hypothetical protein FWD57_13715, partial [Polyangiaceae bacterium]|nr:hypothetical protein [Polyangiaceae bacterium]
PFHQMVHGSITGQPKQPSCTRCTLLLNDGGSLCLSFRCAWRRFLMSSRWSATSSKVAAWIAIGVSAIGGSSVDNGDGNK